MKLRGDEFFRIRTKWFVVHRDCYLKYKKQFICVFGIWKKYTEVNFKVEDVVFCGYWKVLFVFVLVLNYLIEKKIPNEYVFPTFYVFIQNIEGVDDDELRQLEKGEED